MIFLSHNWKDKAVVEQFAVALAAAFGQDQVFYDSWSIQPGEGIIDKMNSGLGSADMFFFFVSTNSLQSKMVDLEWQNGLMKASKGKMRLVPIKMDGSLIPPILMQSVYLDLFTNGLDVTLRQVLDIARGQNTFVRQHENFSNVGYSHQAQADRVVIEIKALHFMEPRAHFVILTDLGEDVVRIQHDLGLATEGFNAGLTLDDGRKVNGFLFAKESSLLPNFPFQIELINTKGADPRFRGVMHEKSLNNWKSLLPI